MYAVAMLALRVARRRTLAQWTAIDFAATVAIGAIGAIGAIMGRTAVASDQGVFVGIVALATVLAAHSLAMYLRFNRFFAKLVDHRVRVLVDHGELRRDQLLLCGLTENDEASATPPAGVRAKPRPRPFRTCPVSDTGHALPAPVRIGPVRYLIPDRSASDMADAGVAVSRASRRRA